MIYEEFNTEPGNSATEATTNVAPTTDSAQSTSTMNPEANMAISTTFYGIQHSSTRK